MVRKFKAFEQIRQKHVKRITGNKFDNVAFCDIFERGKILK